MDRLKHLGDVCEILPSYIILFFISLFAGIVKFIMRGPYTYKAFFINSAAAALSGIIVYFMCQYKELDPNLTGAIVGMAGYTGTEFLKYILKTAKSIFSYFDKGRIKILIKKLIE